jgi:hypothetical protein
MDIKRFFDSVDTSILKTLIRKQVQDEKILQIIDMIIDSFFHIKTAYNTSEIPLSGHYPKFSCQSTSLAVAS